MNFDYRSLRSSRVIFRPGAARERLAPTVESLDARRVLVIASTAEEELARLLVAPLGRRVAGLFTQVRPHVPLPVAEAAREAASSCEADLLLSIGGGSTTGTAKAVALTSHLPVLAVPTTYAGSEVTPVWGITDGVEKAVGRADHVMPDTVIYDPELTLTLPVGVSVMSGINALAHCVEALWAPGANPLTSVLAEQGLQALADGLASVVEDPFNIEARALVMYGAWLAGLVFAVAGSSLHHKLAHMLGGRYDLPHAETHAALIPYVTALLCRSLPAMDVRVAAALGATPGTPAAVALEDIERRLGASVSLRDLGLPKESFTAVVDEAIRRDAAAPHEVGRDELQAMLAAAWHGSPVTTVIRGGYR